MWSSMILDLADSHVTERCSLRCVPVWCHFYRESKCSIIVMLVIKKLCTSACLRPSSLISACIVTVLEQLQ